VTGGCPLKSDYRKVTVALLIATFLSAIEVTIVSTAMPVISSQLGGMHLISWVYATYLLSSAVMTPIFGKLADLFGRKKMFIISVSIFLLGSMLCGISQSMEQLIFFRLIQGLGAGGLIPLSQTIIGDIFQFERRAKVQGLISSIWGISGLLGPILGGVLTEYLSWHWIFFINIPFGLLSMVMIGKYLHQELEYRQRKIDYAGAVTFMAGMGTLLFTLLSGGQTLSWRSLSVVILLIISIVLLTIFILIQLKHPEPLVPLKLFRKKEVAISNLSSFLGSGILIGLNAYLPLWIQGVLLLKATSSGLTLIPMSLGWPLGAFITGQLITRLGSRKIAIIGVILIAGGTLLLTTIKLSTPYWMLVGMMFLIGMGFGCSFTVYTLVVQSAVDTSLRGAATSSNTFLRVMGQSVGIALLGSVLNRYIGNHPESLSPDLLAGGLHVVFIILAIIALINLSVTLWIPRFQPGHEKQPV
jgi:EmrB/QacA subfamily drug resistance transporter